MYTKQYDKLNEEIIAFLSRTVYRGELEYIPKDDKYNPSSNDEFLEVADGMIDPEYAEPDCREVLLSETELSELTDFVYHKMHYKTKAYYKLFKWCPQQQCLLYEFDAMTFFFWFQTLAGYCNWIDQNMHALNNWRAFGSKDNNSTQIEQLKVLLHARVAMLNIPGFNPLKDVYNYNNGPESKDAY